MGWRPCQQRHNHCGGREGGWAGWAPSATIAAAPPRRAWAAVNRCRHCLVALGLLLITVASPSCAWPRLGCCQSLRQRPGVHILYSHLGWEGCGVVWRPRPCAAYRQVAAGAQSGTVAKEVSQAGRFQCGQLVGCNGVAGPCASHGSTAQHRCIALHQPSSPAQQRIIVAARQAHTTIEKGRVRGHLGCRS